MKKIRLPTSFFTAPREHYALLQLFYSILHTPISADNACALIIVLFIAFEKTKREKFAPYMVFFKAVAIPLYRCRAL